MKLYSPKIFEPCSNIEAFFTESNREQINPDGPIPGLNLGFNTDAPASEVEKNMHLLFSFLNWDSSNMATAEQVHGFAIQQVEKPGVYQNADGLVTTQKSIAIGIKVADCAAVLVADPVNEVAGAFHAGWRGAVGEIIPKGIEYMTGLGAEKEHLLVYVSPCISQNNFEVGEEVASKFSDRFVDAKNFKKPHVDLAGFIVHQLRQAGVSENQMEISGQCTVSDSKYFSYRRERNRSGRMLALIRLT